MLHAANSRDDLEDRATGWMLEAELPRKQAVQNGHGFI